MFLKLCCVLTCGRASSLRPSARTSTPRRRPLWRASLVGAAWGPWHARCCCCPVPLCRCCCSHASCRQAAGLDAGLQPLQARHAADIHVHLSPPTEDAGFPEACFKISYDHLVIGVGCAVCGCWHLAFAGCASCAPAHVRHRHPACLVDESPRTPVQSCLPTVHDQHG